MGSRIVLGFIAAVLAVLVVHQPIIAGLTAADVIKSTVYNMEPLRNAPPMLASAFAGIGFKGWPILFNQMFWGGMWGVLFGAALSRLPMAAWVKGLILGLLVAVAGSWLLVPYFKGGPYFGGLDPMRMGITALINLPFGIATGIFYSLMARNS